jgi:hypothetical protein
MWLAGNGQRYPLHPWSELQWESSFDDRRVSGVLALPPGLNPGERQAFHIDTPGGSRNPVAAGPRRAASEGAVGTTADLGFGGYRGRAWFLVPPPRKMSFHVRSPVIEMPTTIKS